MKICQVNPGCGIEIPPKGWGAIEKIVWEFTTNLRKQGHQVDIKWTDEIKKDEYDIVHVHVANLALILAEKGIPYIFQCHDHHAYHHGKDSFVFKQNLEAIEKSELSILPAKYLVDYFGSNKATYFSHGVDIDFFTPNLEKKPHKLLMVANNGLGGEGGYDRKGFTEGIKAAFNKKLPLTIAGPENNKKFIEDNPWVKDYNVNWVYSPNQEELLKLYQDHTIFLHPSELEAGHPNLTILEAMACGLPVVGCMESNLKGMVKVDKKWEKVADGIEQITLNYDKFKSQALNTSCNLSWYNRSLELIKLVKPSNMKDILVKEYSNTKKLSLTSTPPKPEFYLSFLNGARCEIKGPTSDQYKIEFMDPSLNDKVLWGDTIKSGMWTECNKKYFVPWKIKITNLTANKVSEYNFNCENKIVQIQLDSKSIGDTLAWFPYVEEFRKKHNCKIVCSTFHNDWFESLYPEIEFVQPGTPVKDIYALYNIGWYYFKDGKKDMSKHPIDFLSQSLQKTASDILGLQHKEVKPLLSVKEFDPPTKDDYVVIAPHGTKHASYWNHPGGWQTIIDYLNNKGYKVVMSSVEPLGDNWHDSKLGGTLKNVIDRTQKYSLQETLSFIKNAKAFIGIGTGLTWVSWALNKPTILISGFSEPYTEMEDCIRVSTPPGKCTGCFNKHRLDPGDWEWCPEHKDTPRHFECSKSITPDLVIKEIDRILK